MSDPADNTNGTPPMSSGGAGFALDPKSEKDRGLARMAMRRWPNRWRGLTDSVKEEFVHGLVEAGRVCRSQLTDPENSLDAAKTLGSIVKTAAAMERQVQADEHLDEQYNRIDAGLATNRVDTAHTHELIAVDATARAAARALAARLAPIETKAVYSKPVPNLNGHSNGTTNGTSNGHTNGTH